MNLPRGFLLGLAMVTTSACRPGSPAPAPAPTDAASADPVVAPPPAPPRCNHRRPFADSDKALVLPAPFDTFEPCDVRSRILEQDHTTGGNVRIDRVHRWDIGGRTLLAALYYRGEDAEGKLLCDTCRVTAHLAILERRGASLALAATAHDTWQPAADASAHFNGRADFGPELAFDGGETLLALKTPWSGGAPGTWTNLTLYRLVGDRMEIVLEYEVDWWASGRGTEDDDEVVSAITAEPRPSGPSDVVFKTTELRCREDYASLDPRPICRAPKQVGTERWRFVDGSYHRIEGKPAPMPGVLHRLWGWSQR
jgi:hypothetical protein